MNISNSLFTLSKKTLKNVCQHFTMNPLYPINCSESANLSTYLLYGFVASGWFFIQKDLTFF